MEENIPHINSESFWIINYFFLFTFDCILQMLCKECVVFIIWCKKVYVCGHTHSLETSLMEYLLGTICGCSGIWNSLSVTDSHGLVLYCYVTITAPLFCVAVHVIATVPRLAITCSLSVSVFLCQMKRKERIDVWVESMCPEGSINSE